MGTDIHPVVQVRDANKEWHDIEIHPSTLEDRCYALFAVLANVRNGFGFAGVPTGEPVKPIAEPRGLPADYITCDDDNLGYHDFTWVTLRELNEYPWHASRMKTGVISLERWQKWDKHSNPEEYSGAITGRDIVTVSHDDALFARFPKDKRIFVQVTWAETIADSVRGFFTEVLPWLRTLGEPDEVRIVMGFDS